MNINVDNAVGYPLERPKSVNSIDLNKPMNSMGYSFPNSLRSEKGGASKLGSSGSVRILSRDSMVSGTDSFANSSNYEVEEIELVEAENEDN